MKNSNWPWVWQWVSRHIRVIDNGYEDGEKQNLLTLFPAYHNHMNFISSLPVKMYPNWKERTNQQISNLDSYTNKGIIEKEKQTMSLHTFLAPSTKVLFLLPLGIAMGLGLSEDMAVSIFCPLPLVHSYLVINGQLRVSRSLIQDVGEMFVSSRDVVFQCDIWR